MVAEVGVLGSYQGILLGHFMWLLGCCYMVVRAFIDGY